jgi:Transposase and inactivated derivatives
MVTVSICCKYCGEKERVVKMGKNRTGRPRCLCRACGRTFQTSYQYKAYEAGVKERIVQMSTNGSGIRNIARVLQVGTNTVISTLKKKDLDYTGKSGLSKEAQQAGERVHKKG